MQRNYNRDMYECEREAIFAGRDNKQQVFDSCMKTRGYIPFLLPIGPSGPIPNNVHARY